MFVYVCVRVRVLGGGGGVCAPARVCDMCVIRVCVIRVCVCV